LPAPSVPLKIAATLGDTSTLDVTASSTGITYQSSIPGVAQVTASGVIIGQAPGATTITASYPGGASTQIPVQVTAFTPTPQSAYPLGSSQGGFASNSDIAGTLVYVADGAAGLQIMDVTSGSLLGGVVGFGGHLAVDVRVRGTLAAVALGTGGFALVDVS